MKTLAKTALTTAATLVALASPALADQFIVTVSEPLVSVNQRLLDTLRITVIDSFTHDGKTFTVLDAPSEAYVETLFSAISTKPLSLHQLAVDWTGPAMTQIDTTARLRFTAPLDCGFCS